MKKLFIYLLLLFCGIFTTPLSGQHPTSGTKQNPYKLDITGTLEQYELSVKEDPDNRLVDLEKYIPGIKLDIRYATENNFTKTRIYTLPKAYLRKPAARALKKVQKELKREGLGIVIYDAYRPYAGTLYFYQVYKDTAFVASPRTGSVHNRGCAVDLGLVELKTGRYLEMPTEFDSFTKEAAADYKDLPSLQIANRKRLQEVMTKYGFEIYEAEWWHFNFRDRKKYKLTDIPFEEL